jgi:hypothetical protein
VRLYEDRIAEEKGWPSMLIGKLPLRQTRQIFDIFMGEDIDSPDALSAGNATKKHTGYSFL